MCCLCVTYVLFMCYICVIYVPSMCYRCVTDVLYMCHESATYMLFIMCRATYVLLMCYFCSTYSQSLRAIRRAESRRSCKVRGKRAHVQIAPQIVGRPTEPPARYPDPVAHHPLSGIAAVGSCRCRFSPTHTAHHNGFQHRPTQQAALLHERWPTRKAALQHAPCPVRSAAIP